MRMFGGRVEAETQKITVAYGKAYLGEGHMPGDGRHS